MWWAPLLALSAAQAEPEPCVRVCDVVLPISPAAAEALLGDRPYIWWIQGNVLTVVARREGEASLCCAIQRPLHPIGRGLQAISVRIPDIETAIVDVDVMPNDRHDPAPVWRGPAATPAPEQNRVPSGQLSGHRFDSAILGQRRGILVYVPPGIAEGQRVPVIYIADGLASEFGAIANAHVRSGHSAPVILVGIDNAGSSRDFSCVPRCDPRSQEYLIDIPNATPAESRFDTQARFILEEVIPFVESHYPVMRTREGRTTMGYSSGAAWAVTMAARHPEMFGNVIGLSLGWQPAAATASLLGHDRVYLGAGRLEAGRFLARTSEAAERARSAGADVTLVTPNGGHDFAMWDILFADALVWLAPPRPNSPTNP
jgi:enterochelin esterase-like enzyme